MRWIVRAWVCPRFLMERRIGASCNEASAFDCNRNIVYSQSLITVLIHLHSRWREHRRPYTKAHEPIASQALVATTTTLTHIYWPSAHAHAPCHNAAQLSVQCFERCYSGLWPFGARWPGKLVRILSFHCTHRSATLPPPLCTEHNHQQIIIPPLDSRGFGQRMGQSRRY
jgi:hypothetical protein